MIGEEYMDFPSCHLIFSTAFLLTVQLYVSLNFFEFMLYVLLTAFKEHTQFEFSNFRLSQFCSILGGRRPGSSENRGVDVSFGFLSSMNENWDFNFAEEMCQKISAENL